MPPEFYKHSHWFVENVYPHESLLRAWLQGRFPDANNIDDIIQDSYLRVLRAREKQDLFAPKAFLFSTARHLALDHMKSHKISRMISLVDGDVSTLLDTDDLAPEQLARKQELVILKEAIQSLPKRCRQIMTLHKIYGLPHKEVAERLGISIHSVSTQLEIGLRKCTQFAEPFRKEGKS